MGMLIVVESLVLLAVTAHGFTDVVCPNNMTHSAVPGNDKPKLPKSYQVQIFGTVVQKGVTFTAEEYVDTSSKMAAIAIKSTTGRDMFVLDGNMNETYQMKNGTCTVQHHSLDPLDQVKENLADQPYPLTMLSILNMSKKNQAYLGKSVVRGLKTKHWQSCGHWPGVNTTVRLDYYFSESTDLVKTYDVPVRVEVKGQGIYLIYDYFGFAVDVDSSVFLTPPVTACPSSASSRTIPKLKTQFRYRTETKRMGTINNLDVWYDFNTKLVRLDYTLTQSCKESLCSPHSMTELQDYKTAYMHTIFKFDFKDFFQPTTFCVTYTVDHTVGSCTIHPTDGRTWLAKQDKGGISLNTPEEMFFLDDTFIYVGEKAHRGIDCSVFSSVKRRLPEYPNMDMNVDIYFIKEGMYSSSDMTSTSKPVMVRMYNTTTELETVVDIFEFSDEVTSVIDKFDISTCFNNDQKKKLTITFSSDPNAQLPDKSLLVETVKEKMIEAVPLNPLRLQESDVWWDAYSMYFTATLLDKPSAETKFHRGTELIPQYKGDLLLTGVISLDSCATSCDTQIHATCNSFDMCPGESCTLNLNYSSPGVLSGPVDHELALSDTYTRIEQMVTKGSFRVAIPVNGKSEDFIATSTTEGTKQATASQTKKHLNPVAVMNSFEVTRGVQLMENHFPVVAVNVSSISLEDCAYSCLSELVFTCLAFGYVHNTSVCVLHSLYPDQNPDLLAPCVDCDLYTRTWLQQYAPTQASNIPPDATTLREIHKINYCAMACVRLYECETFHYSFSQLTCILFKHPKPSDNTSLPHTGSDWKYYTRIYTDDFVMTSYRGVWQEADKGYNSALQDDCAQYCVAETSFRCQMFTWCEDYTMCSLYSLSLYDSDHVSTFPATKCWIYNREYNTDGRRFIPQFSKNASLSTPSVINTTPKATTSATLVPSDSNDSPIAAVENVTKSTTPVTKNISKPIFSTTRVKEPVITNTSVGNVSSTSEPEPTTKSHISNTAHQTTHTAKFTLTSDNPSTTTGNGVSTSATINVTHTLMSSGTVMTPKKNAANITAQTTNNGNPTTPADSDFNATIPTPNATKRNSSLPSYVNTTIATSTTSNSTIHKRTNGRITPTKGSPSTTVVTQEPLTTIINNSSPDVPTTGPTTFNSKTTNSNMKTKPSISTSKTSTIKSNPPCSHVTETPCVCPSETATTKSSGSGEPECHPLSSAAKSSYPTGTVAGVAVGMLILGIIVGVAVIFLKNRYSTGSYTFSGKTFKNASFSP